MLLSAVSVLVVAQSSSEIPEGLMNNPVLNFLISSGSKKKEPRCACLSEAKASHSHKMWTKVASSVTHFLQVGLLLSPVTYKCLLKVLRPVRRPITTLDCVLLKDNNRALVANLGPKINYWAYLCVLQGPRHNTKCWLSIQHFIFLLIFCLQTPNKGSQKGKVGSLFSRMLSLLFIQCQELLWRDTAMSAWCWHITISSAWCWPVTISSAWCWPVTISSAKVYTLLMAWCFCIQEPFHFSLLILCLFTQSYTPCNVCFVCASHWLLFSICAKKNVIILHFSLSSLWHWYNKFVNDWCVFWGGLGKYIVSCAF
jgi:hypothetical protein